MKKAKIPIDLATLRDFLFYLLFYLAISFPIVSINIGRKPCLRKIFSNLFFANFTRELLTLFHSKEVLIHDFLYVLSLLDMIFLEMKK